MERERDICQYLLSFSGNISVKSELTIFKTIALKKEVAIYAMTETEMETELTD